MNTGGVLVRIPAMTRARPSGLLMGTASVVVVGLAAAACTSTSTVAARHHKRAASTPAAASAATFTVRDLTSPTLGDILVTSTGMALYTYGPDVGHNGMATCTGGCLQIWPPLTVPAGTTPTSGPGVAGTLAAVRQANGSNQVTLNGQPLYTFAQDRIPGHVTGNGVAGFAVARNSSSAPSAPPTTAAPTTTAAPAPPAPRSTTPSNAPQTTAPQPTMPASTAPPPTQPPPTTGPPTSTPPTTYNYGY